MLDAINSRGEPRDASRRESRPWREIVVASVCSAVNVSTFEFSGKKTLEREGRKSSPVCEEYAGKERVGGKEQLRGAYCE